MERKFKFTKADTAAVKGIAIIFLILYHGFSIKSPAVWVSGKLLAAVGGKGNGSLPCDGSVRWNFCIPVSVWSYSVDESPVS